MQLIGAIFLALTADRGRKGQLVPVLLRITAKPESTYERFNALAYYALLEHVRQHRDGNFPPKHENEKMASFVDADKTELIKQAKQKAKK